jgi:hypothetical protein
MYVCISLCLSFTVEHCTVTGNKIVKGVKTRTRGGEEEKTVLGKITVLLLVCIKCQIDSYKIRINNKL